MLRTIPIAALAALISAAFSMEVFAQHTQASDRHTEQRQNYVQGEDHSGKTIAEVLSEKDRFSKFAEALALADMQDLLNSGDYTVFAPSNEAFERLPNGTWDSWTAPGNREQLREILSYHIVTERAAADDFDDSRSDYATLNDGGDLRITNNLGNFSVNTAAVTHADIQAENGYIHVIDSVLVNSRQRAQQTTDE